MSKIQRHCCGFPKFRRNWKSLMHPRYRYCCDLVNSYETNLATVETTNEWPLKSLTAVPMHSGARVKSWSSIGFHQCILSLLLVFRFTQMPRVWLMWPPFIDSDAPITMLHTVRLADFNTSLDFRSWNPHAWWQGYTVGFRPPNLSRRPHVSARPS